MAEKLCPECLIPASRCMAAPNETLWLCDCGKLWSDSDAIDPEPVSVEPRAPGCAGCGSPFEPGDVLHFGESKEAAETPGLFCAKCSR